MISLQMEVEIVDGLWVVVAPWGSASGDSFEECYWDLMKRRAR